MPRTRKKNATPKRPTKSGVRGRGTYTGRRGAARGNGGGGAGDAGVAGVSPGLPDRNDAARWQSGSIRPCRPRAIVSESMHPRRATLRSRGSSMGSMNVPIRSSSLGNAPRGRWTTHGSNRNPVMAGAGRVVVARAGADAGVPSADRPRRGSRGPRRCRGARWRRRGRAGARGLVGPGAGAHRLRRLGRDRGQGDGREPAGRGRRRGERGRGPVRRGGRDGGPGGGPARLRGRVVGAAEGLLRTSPPFSIFFE